MLSIKLNMIHNETADLITYAEEVLAASVEPVNYDDLYIMEQKMERIERMAGEIRERKHTMIWKSRTINYKKSVLS